MVINAKEIARLSVTNSVLLEKEVALTRDAEAVRNKMNEDHVIHGTGLCLQCEIVLSGIVKALSEISSHEQGDSFDRWPPLTLAEFEKATENWVRRSALVGNDLAYYLQILQEKNILHIVAMGTAKSKIIISLTKKGVLLLLKCAGL